MVLEPSQRGKRAVPRCKWRVKTAYTGRSRMGQGDCIPLFGSAARPARRSAGRQKSGSFHTSKARFGTEAIARLRFSAVAAASGPVEALEAGWWKNKPGDSGALVLAISTGCVPRSGGVFLWEWRKRLTIHRRMTRAENGGETRTVQAIDPGPNGTSIITLDSPLARTYWASTNDGANPPTPTFQPDPLDGSLHSAGFGVIHSADNLIYDTASNQINGTGSAFYDADMRNVEQSFDDAYIEFLARLSGSGALPYLPDSDATRWDFAWVWFANQNAAAYIHLIGSSSNTAAWGTTVRYINTPIVRAYRTSYVFEGGIEQDVKAGSGYCIEGTVASGVNQAVTNHEKGHQFHVNPTGTHGHCTSQAWPATGICLMNASQCPSVDPNRYDADASSTTSPNGGDVFDVRVCVEGLPND